MNAKERKELAAQISAVMKNPNTPGVLYDAIGDVLTFYSNYLDYTSAELIEKSFAAYEEKGADQEPDIISSDGISVIC